MDNTVPSMQQRPTQQPVSLGVPKTPASDAVIVSSDDTAVPTSEEKKQQPAGSSNKEFGPMSSSGALNESGGQVENDDDDDEVKVAKQEVMLGQKVSPAKEVPISQELKEAGIEQGADTEPELPVVVQHAGIRSIDADSAVPVISQVTIKLPISYAHAQQLDKRSKIKESIKWFARYMKRQWERVQFLEKQKGEKLQEL